MKRKKVVTAIAALFVVVLAALYLLVNVLSFVTAQPDAARIQRARAELKDMRQTMSPDVFERRVKLHPGMGLKESFADMGKQAGVEVIYTGRWNWTNSQLTYDGPLGAAMHNLADNNGCTITKEGARYIVRPK